MNEPHCIVSVHLPHLPDTNQVAPEGTALIIGPGGILQTRVLSAEELALFAPDERVGQLEAELIRGDWRRRNKLMPRQSPFLPASH
jgi:hypothetical protein